MEASDDAVIGLTRRQLGLCGAAVGLFGAEALAQPATPSVRLPDGSNVPALGQGSWHLGQDRHPASEEEEALRTGISLGLTLIDTAELYGGGRAEQMIGRVIAGQRDKVFLVSKVAPYHATESGIRQACAASLARLGTDYLDLYLLHWLDGGAALSAIVDSFESLRAEGRIRRWGVSNFNVRDMEDLYRVRRGDGCATNQVRYSLQDRTIERDLLPWCEQHGLPIMAYSPLGQGGDLLRNAALARVAERHQSYPAAVALAWTIRSGHVISIPESGSPEHVRQNASALSLRLTDSDLTELERGFAA
jgi:diketogulonate reductase-like aldo/keto reductase